VGGQVLNHGRTAGLSGLGGGPGNRAGFPVSRHLSGRPDPLLPAARRGRRGGAHRWPWCRSPLVGSSGGGLGPV